MNIKVSLEAITDRKVSPKVYLYLATTACRRSDGKLAIGPYPPSASFIRDETKVTLYKVNSTLQRLAELGILDTENGWELEDMFPSKFVELTVEDANDIWNNLEDKEISLLLYFIDKKRYWNMYGKQYVFSFSEICRDFGKKAYAPTVSRTRSIAESLREKGRIDYLPYVCQDGHFRQMLTKVIRKDRSS